MVAPLQYASFSIGRSLASHRFRRFTTAPPSGAVALIFDTETSGKVDFRKSELDPSQPALVQLGMILVDTDTWMRRMQMSLLIRGVSSIEPGAHEVHGISTEDCERFGVPQSTAVRLFQDACDQADVLVAHNMAFDKKIVSAAIHREGLQFSGADDIPLICTMQTSTDVLKLPGKYRGKYKWPSLEEAYTYFTKSEQIEGSHDALVDAEACLAVLRGLVECGSVELATRDKSMDLIADSNKKVDPVKITEESAVEPLPDRLDQETGVVQYGDLEVQSNDDGSFHVKGRGTFRHKESLKTMGGRWNPVLKAWAFNDGAMLGCVKELSTKTGSV